MPILDIKERRRSQLRRYYKIMEDEERHQALKDTVRPKQRVYMRDRQFLEKLLSHLDFKEPKDE